MSIIYKSKRTCTIENHHRCDFPYMTIAELLKLRNKYDIHLLNIIVITMRNILSYLVVELTFSSTFRNNKQ